MEIPNAGGLMAGGALDAAWQLGGGATPQMGMSPQMTPWASGATPMPYGGWTPAGQFQIRAGTELLHFARPLLSRLYDSQLSFSSGLVLTLHHRIRA